MPIDRMDHFTILTTDAEKTVAFYNDILGFTPGPRPAFSFPGAWLYNDGKAVLHVVERSSIPEGGGRARSYRLLGHGRRRPISPSSRRAGSNIIWSVCLQPGHAGGVWQLFFFDPSGARVEIDFAASETVEGQGPLSSVLPARPHVFSVLGPRLVPCFRRGLAS